MPGEESADRLRCQAGISEEEEGHREQTGPESHGVAVDRERDLTSVAYAAFCPNPYTSQQVKDGSEIMSKWEVLKHGVCETVQDGWQKYPWVTGGEQLSPITKAAH